MIISNSLDYSREFIENNIDAHSAAVLAEVSKERHIYVACDGERIIGTGDIAGYWGSLTESILLTVFVLPEYQGRGVGRKIIETLGKDVYFNDIAVQGAFLPCDFKKIWCDFYIMAKTTLFY